MAHMFIDGQRVEFTDEKNILDVIRKAGIDMPTFCYYTELSIYGACRMCVIEDDRGRVSASCSEPPRDGMVIKTTSEKLQRHRKLILELLLSSHCRDCTTCEKNQRCKLQELAIRFNIRNVRFEDTREVKETDESSASIVINPNKCILCGDCVRVCKEKQGIAVMDFINRGSEMRVGTQFNTPYAETQCVNCGQCAATCPTGAILIKNETVQAWKYIQDEDVKTIVQVAPAVRVALGEEFGVHSGENVMGKIAAALRILGFDEVYDTSISADLTIMEETSEFVDKLKNGKEMPLFTSCCPAWIKYAEEFYPELMPNISTCKSPMGMLGAIIKEQGRSMQKVDGKRRCSIAIMPCTAKKYEAKREELANGGEQNVDLVLTTQELIYMIKEAGIDFKNLAPKSVDMPFGIFSGAGVIFGNTGGVMEAVLRRVTEERTDKALEEIAYTGVRGFEGVKEATIPLGDTELNIAVVNGLANTKEFLERMKNGDKQYHLIEIMACPGGCISGGGQPKTMQKEREERAKGLYKIDEQLQIKRSDENPIIISMYNGLLKNRTHELLHVKYNRKKDK